MKMFTIIAMVLFIAGVPVIAAGQSDSSSMAMEDTAMGPFIEFMDMDKAMMLAEEKPTVLFFHAAWCPSCKSASKDFEENASRLGDVNLIVVDYDNSKELQKKYGVTYQHTFVQISPEGETIVKWNGGATDELLEKIMMKTM